MTTYFINIKQTVSNVRVYTIKKKIKGDTNKISKVVDSLIKKYVLNEKPEVHG